MSKAGTNFLEAWIDEFVIYTDKGAESVRAMALAEQCRVDAAAVGITTDDMEPKFGTVENIILEAMHYAAGTPSN
jgi:hypothetical protein